MGGNLIKSRSRQHEATLASEKQKARSKKRGQKFEDDADRRWTTSQNWLNSDCGSIRDVGSYVRKDKWVDKNTAVRKSEQRTIDMIKGMSSKRQSEQAHR